jgi:iron complex outermembrane recepter protein
LPHRRRSPPDRLSSPERLRAAARLLVSGSEELIMRHHLLACAALPPLLLAATPAAAQDKPAATDDQILVVGQKNAPISIAPRGLSVSLGEEQFAAVNATDVEDLMKYAPDFFVRKRFIGDNNAVPGFRGTHSTQSARALVLVDGMLISNFLGNSFSFPPKWGVVGPGEVEQFDVVYGPYSARYPGNSMGGIVNITTRDPEGTEAFAKAQGIAQFYRQYGTREDLLGWSGEAGVAFKQENGPFSFRLSGRRLRNAGQPQQFYQLTPAASAAGAIPVTGAVNDPELITKAPVFGDYSRVDTIQDQVRTKLGFESGDFAAQASFVYWWNTEDETHPATYLRSAATGAPVYGGTGNNVKVLVDGTAWYANGSNLAIRDKNEWLAGLKLSGPVLGFDTRLNLSRFRTDRQRVRQSNGYANGLANGAGILTSQGPTGWEAADLLMERDAGAHHLALGGNLWWFETDQTQANTANWRTATGSVFANRTFGKATQFGLFVEDRLRLAPEIAVTAGVRADFWHAYDGGIERAGTGAAAGQIVGNRYASRRDSAVSPALSLEARLAPGWNAQLSLATATRFPTVGELFQGTLNGDGTFNLDSFDPNLKPERSKDANLILRHQAGPLAITASLFWQDIKNSLFRFAGFNQFGVLTTANFNIDRVRQYGAELIAEAKDFGVDGLDLDANAAWIDSEILDNPRDPTTEGVQFPRIPRWRLNGNARWRFAPAWQGVIGVRYASRPNTDLQGLQRGDTYGYTSELFALDLRLNWDASEQLRFSAGVDNLTNDRAWVFHPYPQRVFLLEAGWRL